MTLFCIANYTKQAIHLAKLKTENIIYDPNTSSKSRFKKLETELKWIKLWQSHFPEGFNHKIQLCQNYNISNMSDFDVLSLLNVRSVKLDLMVNVERKKKRLL